MTELLNSPQCALVVMGTATSVALILGTALFRTIRNMERMMRANRIREQLER